MRSSFQKKRKESRLEQLLTNNTSNNKRMRITTQTTSIPAPATSISSSDMITTKNEAPEVYALEESSDTETTMDLDLDLPHCPVCWDVTTGEKGGNPIQCRNGHVICASCAEGVTKCYTCNVKMDPSNPIICITARHFVEYVQQQQQQKQPLHHQQEKNNVEASPLVVVKAQAVSATHSSSTAMVDGNDEKVLKTTTGIRQRKNQQKTGRSNDMAKFRAMPYERDSQPKSQRGGNRRRHGRGAAATTNSRSRGSSRRQQEHQDKQQQGMLLGGGGSDMVATIELGTPNPTSPHYQCTQLQTVVVGTILGYIVSSMIKFVVHNYGS